MNVRGGSPLQESPPWLRALDRARLASGSPTDAKSVRQDSRAVTAGDVFVAIPGLTVDGNAYIERAIAAGARNIIVQEDRQSSWAPLVAAADIAFVAVPDARIALAQAAAGVAGHPARTMGVIGVTGTDGKTTTTHLIAHVLSRRGDRAGHLSSVEYGDGERADVNSSHMTTVEADEIQRQLAKMRAAGCRYAVVEASSIGLDLHRVDECEFDVGVFTNLAPDHLDYHKTMSAYRDAKALLFRMLATSVDKRGLGIAKAAILNADDPASKAMGAATNVPMLTYGLREAADISARDITTDGFGTRFVVVGRGGEREAVRTGLLGAYNVANCLAAVAVAVSQQIDLRDAVRTLASFGGVPGRMERIDAGQPFRVVVDIASTEQAMRNVLAQLRPLTEGRLIVVFGAAGERDHERRSGIARAVAEVADAAVITNEDPRSEDPESILSEIAAALRAASFTAYRQEADRRSAIVLAFEAAAKGDTVLLAGKGTEQSIVIGKTHHPWDERRVARQLLTGESSL